MIRSGRSAGADVGRAGRGRVHLRGGDQLRAGLPPVPAAGRAARGAQPPGRGDRAEADGAGRGLVRDHAEHLVRRAGGGRVDAVPGAEVPAARAPLAPRGAAASAGEVLRPVVSRDTEFFWAGTAAGELRIQRCDDCGALRHPPGPMCPRCGGERPGYVVAAGTGEVYSYVVHRHPPVPGRTLPIVIALVALDEGVRMVGELTGTGAGPGAHRPAGPGRVPAGGRRADAARVAGAGGSSRRTTPVPAARPGAGAGAAARSCRSCGSR